ncbi:MAG: ABC transporter ATP-binding protein [Planctomycetota bacterium]|jgi:ABC-2 type transport system ATP-binding protein
MGATPIVAAENLTRVFRSGFLGRKRFPALTDVSLRVERGDVFALLGPNGSGKTTFMKILLGLLKPSGGRATVLDLPPGHPDALARIGYMAEIPAFLPLLTGAETLHLAGRVLAMDRRHRSTRIDELLRRFGLEKDAHRPAGDYSQGMKKRLALAQALINDPELLLLDEPTAALDPASAQTVQDLVRESAQAGKTVLLSSHLLARVEEVASRICILHHGRIIRSGSLSSLAEIPGVFDLRVQGDPARAEQALREGGCIVESTKPASRSLEEMFLQLTGDGEPEVPPPGDPPGEESKA